MKIAMGVTLVCIALLIFVAPVWSAPQSEDAGQTSVGAAPMGKYNEAPMLAAMVGRGELPVVDLRLPNEPKVVPSVESIGTYGGELQVYSDAPHPAQDLQEPRHGANLYRIPRSGVGLEPDLAIAWEMDSEENSFTVFLREGTKWSDGSPFTSEDFRFWREDMIGQVAGFWGTFGITSVEVVDDLTVKLFKTGGIGGTEYQLSDWQGGGITSFWPSDYLKQFHADYNDDAEELAEEAGFDTWELNLEAKRNFWPIENNELPRLDPWILTQFGTSQRIYERNPYFWRVDPDGNQLPYIDRIVANVVQPEVYHLKVGGGDADIAFNRTNLQNFSLYQTDAEENNLRVELYPGTMSSAFTLAFGLTHPDPAIRSIVDSPKFHQALSVAIDRDDMNRVLAFGLGVPGQASPLPSVSYYKEGWREHFAQFDTDLANSLLDEIGMDERDREGFRLRPDGEPFTFIMEYWVDRLTPAMELLTEYFNAVGVKTIMKQEDVNLWVERITTGEAMVSMHGGDWYPASNERRILQALATWRDSELHSGLWAAWWTAKRAAVLADLGEGAELPDRWWRMDTSTDIELTGEKPPEHWIVQFELEQEFGQQEPGSARYRELGQQFFDYYLDRLINIGTIGEVPRPLVVRKNLVNVPPPGYVAGASLTNLLMQPYADQFYWK